MQTNPKCMSGDTQTPLYAFYDKTKESKNNGWLWFHRDLTPADLINFNRDHLLSHLPSGDFCWQGFVPLPKYTVSFKIYQAGKDDKGRDHWVLLSAWWPVGASHSNVLNFEDVVFKHIETSKDTFPPNLRKFDYFPEFVKLIAEGGELEVESMAEGRTCIESIRNDGKVDIVFYREKPNGKALIKTKKKGS